jgi:S-adenosylmethionine:tRNA ribosyltransferase-isomerase
MKTDLFDFDLPGELIAQHPVQPRDAARLLSVDDGLSDRSIRELPELLRPGDILVFNDTRVIPARLFGRRGSVRIEVTLLSEAATGRWCALAKPAKRLKPGDTIAFAEDFGAQVVAKDGGRVTLEFEAGGPALRAQLERHGAMPLPPYIRRPAGGDPRDRADYQTVFARHEGAIAAPTAGLHFTDRLLDALDRRGVLRTTVTLHVGAGTFLPVKTEDPRDHEIHSEWGRVDEEAVAQIEAARAASGRVVAVGTTALRLLETAAQEDGRLRAFSGATDLFILPGYGFKAVDLLLTNFHLPRSTLFMLVSAFAGLEQMKTAYDHAIAAGYRFYSYGDACLLKRRDRP